MRRCLEKPGGCHYACCLPEDLKPGEMTQWAADRGGFFWLGFFWFGFFLVGDFICFTEIGAKSEMSELK